MTTNEMVEVVQAWQNGAMSRDSMLDIFRHGGVVTEGRTEKKEVRLIRKSEATGTHTKERDQ